MKAIKKRKRSPGARRPAAKRSPAILTAREFLRHTFYYLKGEQYLKASRRLLCETA